MIVTYANALTLALGINIVQPRNYVLCGIAWFTIGKSSSLRCQMSGVVIMQLYKPNAFHRPVFAIIQTSYFSNRASHTSLN